MAAVGSNFNVNTLLFAGTVCIFKYSMFKRSFETNQKAHVSENFKEVPLNQQETLDTLFTSVSISVK